MIADMRRLLFRLSRTALAGALVRWVFAHAVWLLPLRLVVRTPRAVVFHHPEPVCEGHLLAVPRRAIRSLTAIVPADRPWLRELLEVAMAQATAAPTPTLLVVNAGAWQDVPQLHVHLLGPGEVPARRHRVELPPADPAEVLERARDVMAAEVPERHGCALVVDPTSGTAAVVWGPRRERA